MTQVPSTPAPAKIVEQKSNPAGAAPSRPPRVPMSNARQRLAVKDLPGYYLYWFREENVPAALEAWYEPVKRGELSLNNVAGISNKLEKDGNTDLGSNVSIVAGKDGEGAPVRLVLMKLPEEYHKQDLAERIGRMSVMLEAVFGEDAKQYMNDKGQIVALDPSQYVNLDRDGNPIKVLMTRPKRVKKTSFGRR